MIPDSQFKKRISPMQIWQQRRFIINPAPAFDQSSLQGAFLPDPQASINDQYQLVHEPVTYTQGEVAMQLQSNILSSPQPLAHIPCDQCNVTLYNPLIPSKTRT
ncbi:Hypothetical predicted protein [Olea europaea subsp. europaea]|uniref:Uncharacterized protein n=1 Tax=Olea europaea subsp. europaea TaxID=158383 RepID=A0A8S0QJV1_OLEEU|nr:Hypothetical predicted protein [Olea europaea subsp. europaea]